MRGTRAYEEFWKKGAKEHYTEWQGLAREVVLAAWLETIDGEKKIFKGYSFFKKRGREFPNYTENFHMLTTLWKQPNNQDCDKWVAALNKFHVMCRCVHIWWWQCSEVGGESWERALSRQTYFARYQQVKTMLEAQMRYKGMVKLGKRLIELAAQNDTLLDAQSKANRIGQKLYKAAMGIQQMLK